MVKKGIANLDLSKASGPDFIPVVILKNNMCLKESDNNNLIDHLEKRGLFSDFQYDFRSSRSTADLLTVVSDRIPRAFNRSGATRAVANNISKTFYRV